MHTKLPSIGYSGCRGKESAIQAKIQLGTGCAERKCAQETHRRRMARKDRECSKRAERCDYDRGRPEYSSKGLRCEIGRASCRERVEISEVAASLKKKR